MYFARCICVTQCEKRYLFGHGTCIFVPFVPKGIFIIPNTKCVIEDKYIYANDESDNFFIMFGKLTSVHVYPR